MCVQKFSKPLNRLKLKEKVQNIRNAYDNILSRNRHQTDVIFLVLFGVFIIGLVCD